MLCIFSYNISDDEKSIFELALTLSLLIFLTQTDINFLLIMYQHVYDVYAFECIYSVRMCAVYTIYLFIIDMIFCFVFFLSLVVCVLF